MITADVDISRLNSRIEELHDALMVNGGGDVSAIFRDEAMLFLRQVIRLTPPKTREQGENAIRRDLLKIFTPVNQDFLDDLIIEHGHNHIDVWITSSQDDERKHIEFDYASNTGTEMADFHRRNRNARGRTANLKRMSSGWYSPFAVSFEHFAAYRDKILAHVGRRKSGWGKSLVEMGGKVAGWINRHVTSGKAPGEKQIVVGEKPSVTLINRAVGIGADERIVRSALRIRYEAIGRRMRLVVSGYSKDVARGLRIQRQARTSADAFAEAA